MNPVTILCVSALLVAAAITVLLIIVCARWENCHPEDYDQWEDILDYFEFFDDEEEL